MAITMAMASPAQAQVSVIIDNAASIPGCAAPNCVIVTSPVTVPGQQGTSWDITGTLSIASSTQGAATLLDQRGGRIVLTGAASVGTVNIAVPGGSNGTVTVDGSGSALTAPGLLSVGVGGVGALNIANGAVVTSSQGNVASQANSRGTVTVDGSGSAWIMTSSGLVVGNFGNGFLNITNGGAVTVSGGSSTIALGAGNAPGQTGTVTVSGKGSTLTTPNQLYVGYRSTGFLTISDGAVVSASVVGISLSNGTASILSIGAPTGSAPQAPGTLNTPRVVFNNQYLSSGTAPNTDAIIFNHTDNSGNYAFSPQVTGMGYVQVDSGTTALTGDSYYTGGTRINGGTLKLGNGGTTGSIYGNVTDNGMLAFDHSDSYQGSTCTSVTNGGKCNGQALAVGFGGIISGTGAVAQIGTGRTVLTALNTYSGGTAINAGVLEVSQDANLGAAAGLLVFGGGTLATTASFAPTRTTTLNAAGGTFDTAAGTTLTMNGVIGGPGSLRKVNSGNLELTASNSYSGETTISDGALVLSGAGAISRSQRVVDNSLFDITATTSGAAIRSLAGSGSVELGSQTLKLTAANDTFSGVLP